MGVASLAAMALVVAACGGGEAPTSTPTQVPPTPTATAAPTEPPTDAPAMTSGLDWEEVMPAGPKSAPMPAPRKDSTIVHDSANNTLLLFGGREKGQALNDLWSFDLESRMWTEIEAEGPSPRFGHLTVFDVKRSRMVVFSGQAGPNFSTTPGPMTRLQGNGRNCSLKETSPSSGTAAAPATTPRTTCSTSPTGSPTPAASTTPGVSPCDGLLTDLSPDGDRPVKRCLHQCFFDATTGQLVRSGPVQRRAHPGRPVEVRRCNRRLDRDRAGRTGSSARFNYSMAGDPDSGKFFLFAGLTSQGKGDDLWAYSADEGWTDLGSGAPTGLLSNHASVYLSGENALYVFGGIADGESNTLWRVQPN